VTSSIETGSLVDGATRIGRCIKAARSCSLVLTFSPCSSAGLRMFLPTQHLPLNEQHQPVRPLSRHRESIIYHHNVGAERYRFSWKSPSVHRKGEQSPPLVISRSLITTTRCRRINGTGYKGFRAIDSEGKAFFRENGHKVADKVIIDISNFYTCIPAVEDLRTKLKGTREERTRRHCLRCNNWQTPHGRLGCPLRITDNITAFAIFRQFNACPINRIENMPCRWI